MMTYMRHFLVYISLGKAVDSTLNLSAAIGSTLVRQILSSVFYLLAIWITTRDLGPQQNGVLATVLLLPQTLYAFLNMGLAASHIYHLSGGKGDMRAMRGANWLLALMLWLGTVGVLGLSAGASVSKYLPGIGKPLALYASLLLPMMLLAAWTSSLIQGTRDYRGYNRTVLVQPITFLCAVLVLYAADAINVASVLGCYILSQGALWLRSETKVRRLLTAPPAAGYRAGGAIAFGLKAHLSNVITFLNYRLALYLVSFMLDPVATGKYALAIQLAEVLWLIASAASMVVFPESAAHSASPVALEKMIRQVAKRVFQLTLAAGLVGAAVAPFAIPWIFGAAYGGAVLPFTILLPGVVAWSYMSVLSNSLAGMGCQRINVQSALLCLSVNIAGDALAIPHWGVNGAAGASTLAFAVTTFYTMTMYTSIMRARVRVRAA